MSALILHLPLPRHRCLFCHTAWPDQWGPANAEPCCDELARAVPPDQGDTGDAQPLTNRKE